MTDKINIEGFSFGPQESLVQETVSILEKGKPKVEESKSKSVEKNIPFESNVESDIEFKLEPELELESNISLEKIEKIEKDTEKKSAISDIPLKDKYLNTMVIKSIAGVSSLEPMVVYVKTEEGEQIGIPGFFDSTNETFMLMDVSPVPALGFYDKFEEFIKNLKNLKKQKEENHE
jgi:hypothetical protein